MILLKLVAFLLERNFLFPCLVAMQVMESVEHGFYMVMILTVIGDELASGFWVIVEAILCFSILSDSDENPVVVKCPVWHGKGCVLLGQYGNRKGVVRPGKMAEVVNGMVRYKVENCKFFRYKISIKQIANPGERAR